MISKISENFRKFSQNSTKFLKKNVIAELCKGVHCVDLGDSFPTSIYLQNLASIQPRTSPSKFVVVSFSSSGRSTSPRATGAAATAGPWSAGKKRNDPQDASRAPRLPQTCRGPFSAVFTPKCDCKGAILLQVNLKNQPTQ